MRWSTLEAMSVPLITYAQNREDLYLFALIGHIENGFYVDVGANHERLHSVTRLFYERGWSGINIDANPTLIAEFAAERPKDANVNVGVGATDGKMRFREYPRHDGLSTFDEAIMKLHEPSGYPYQDRLIPITTLQKILEREGVRRIDFLKIDVEGFELEVLKGNDWTRFRPTVVLLEATYGQLAIDQMLANGYRLEFFDGLNYYFVEDDAKGVSIHNYSERILRGNVRTHAELVQADLHEERLAGRGDLGIRAHALGLKRAVVQRLRSTWR